MASSVSKRNIIRLRYSKLTLQMNAGTSASDLVLLIVFDRYDYIERSQEDLLFCRSLQADTLGVEIFNLQM